MSKIINDVSTLRDKAPVHVAIICDGNRTWAKRQGLAAFMGHQFAVRNVIEPLVERAAEYGIQYLTFWVFSTENWKREKHEVEFLMNLFREMFDKQIQRLHEKNVRVKLIGDPTKLAEDIQVNIRKGIELTAQNTGITVVIAMNYGGQDEIIRAINKLIVDRDKKSRTGDKKGMEPVTAEEFVGYLDTQGIPDPDFIVRPGGQQRLSGFMSWQSAYSEYTFPQWTFPEFTPEKLDELLVDYSERHRRFGG